MGKNTKQMSMAEKAEKICELAYELGYTHKCRDEQVWARIDLGFKRLHDAISGRCSLQTAIDLDMGEEEKNMDKELKYYTKLISKYTKL